MIGATTAPTATEAAARAADRSGGSDHPPRSGARPWRQERLAPLRKIRIGPALAATEHF